MMRKGIKFLLIVLWMGLIFFFSMDSGVDSSKKSNSIIIQVGEFITHKQFNEEEKEKILEVYETPVRKSAHFLLYFVLELFLLWFIVEFHSLTIKDYLISIIIVFCYACSDEIHQLFVNERSGEILDVMIDTIGGVSSSLIIYLFQKKKKKNI